MGEQQEPASPVTLQHLTAAIDRLQAVLPKSSQDSLYRAQDTIIDNKEFQVGLDLFNKLQSSWCYHLPPAAVRDDAQVGHHLGLIIPTWVLLDP